MNYFINAVTKISCLIFLMISLSISGYSQLVPGVQLVQKKETPSTAIYVFKRGNKRVRLQLKLTGNKVNARIVNPQNNSVLGRMVIGPRGAHGRNIDIVSTRDKLFFLWVFALDRTQNDHGSMGLLTMNASLAPPLMACIQECEQTYGLAELATEDQKGKLVDATKSIGSLSSTSGCVEVIICSEEALSAYDECVEACYQEHGTN